MGNEMSCPCTTNVNLSDEPTPNPDYLAELEKFTLTSKQMIYGIFIIKIQTSIWKTLEYV